MARKEVLALGCVWPHSQPGSGSKVHKPEVLCWIAGRRWSYNCMHNPFGRPGLDSDRPGTSPETFVAFSPVCDVSLTVTRLRTAGLGQDGERWLECVDGVAGLGRSLSRRNK